MVIVEGGIIGNTSTQLSEENISKDADLHVPTPKEKIQHLTMLIIIIIKLTNQQ